MVTLSDIVARVADIPRLNRDTFEPFEAKQAIIEEQAELPVASEGDTIELPENPDTVPVFVDEQTGELLTVDLNTQ